MYFILYLIKKHLMLDCPYITEDKYGHSIKVVTDIVLLFKVHFHLCNQQVISGMLCDTLLPGPST